MKPWSIHSWLFGVSFLIAVGVRATPQFLNEPDDPVSQTLSTTEGHLVLHWEESSTSDQDSIGVWSLQKSNSPDFLDPVLLFSSDPSSNRESFLVSGLNQGLSYFRLIGPEGQEYDRLQVHTQYASLNMVLALLVLGSALFIFLICVICRGEKAHEHLA